MQVSTQSIYIFMEEIRCQKTIKYKEDLNTKLLFLQNDENALATFLHSTDDLGPDGTRFKQNTLARLKGL